MGSRFVQVHAADLINSQPGDGDPTSCIIHLSEEVIRSLVVKELEDSAIFAIESITRIKKDLAKEDLSVERTEFLMRDLDYEREILSHSNYLIHFYGGEQQHLPEDIIHSAKAVQ